MNINKISTYKFEEADLLNALILYLTSEGVEISGDENISLIVNSETNEVALTVETSENNNK